MNSRHPVTVILQDIRSALNVGAIFRTSDGANIEKLYLTGITPYPPHNRIPKTALGAINTVPWEYNKDSLAVIQHVAEIKPIVAIEITPSAYNYFEYQFPNDVAILFGNEINGIDQEMQKLCVATVKIPMFGSKESLNVATAYGIIVYEILRQYYVKGYCR